MMKYILVIAFCCLSLPPLFGCWSGGSSIHYYTTFNSATRKASGFVLSNDISHFPNSIMLDDDIERSEILVCISDVIQAGYYSSHNPDTGESTYSGGEGTVNSYWTLYVYRVSAVDGNTVTVGEQIRAKNLTERMWSTVSSDGTMSGSVDYEMLSPATPMALLDGNERVLCSLYEITTPTVTLAEKTLTYTWNVGDYKPVEFSFSASETAQLLIEKVADSEFTTVTTMDFSRSSLSLPGMELPLSPKVTIGPVVVEKKKYRNPSVKYRLRTAVQSQILVVPTGESGSGTLVDTQSYEAPVTAAVLTATSQDRDTDTFKAKSVAPGRSLPIFGRYSINPEGVIAGEELTCRLILSADGVESNSGDGQMLIITPPVDATQNITVGGTARPER